MHWPTFQKWLQAYSIRLGLRAWLPNASSCQEAWEINFFQIDWEAFGNFYKMALSLFCKVGPWSLSTKLKSLAGAFGNQLFPTRLGSTWPAFPKWLQTYCIRLGLRAWLQNTSPCRSSWIIRFLEWGLKVARNVIMLHVVTSGFRSPVWWHWCHQFQAQRIPWPASWQEHKEGGAEVHNLWFPKLWMQEMHFH